MNAVTVREHTQSVSELEASAAVDQLIVAIQESDPIGKLLTCRLKIRTRLSAFLLAAGIGTLTTLIVPWFDGFLFPRPGVLSSLEDWPGLIITFVTHPAVYVYFLFEQGDMIKSLFAGFHNISRQANALPQYLALLSKVKRWLLWRGWTALIIVLTAAGYVLHILSVLTGPVKSYYYPNEAILLGLNGPTSALAGYMVCMMAVRHLIVVAALFQAVRAHVAHLFAFHPDGCAGLEFMGDFAARAFYLVGILGLDMSLLVAMNLRAGRSPLTEPSLMLFLSSYLVLSPVILILPLAPAFKAMRASREFAKSAILHETDALYGELVDELPPEVADHPTIHKFYSLRRLQQFADSLPLLPISKAAMKRFIAMLIISLFPLLLAIAGWLLFGQSVPGQ